MKHPTELDLAMVLKMARSEEHGMTLQEIGRTIARSIGDGDEVRAIIRAMEEEIQ